MRYTRTTASGAKITYEREIDKPISNFYGKYGKLGKKKLPLPKKTQKLKTPKAKFQTYSAIKLIKAMGRG